ncbi:MAG: hypothetical protein ACMUHB_03180 [Thermoplasmatota archaeon]
MEERALGVSTFVLILTMMMSFAFQAGTGQEATRAPSQQPYADPEITVELDRPIFFTKAEPYPNNEANIDGQITCIIPDYVPDHVFVELTITLIGPDMVYGGLDELFATKDQPEVRIGLIFYPPYDARADDEFPFELQTVWAYSNRGGGSGQAESVFGAVRVSPYGQVSLEPVTFGPVFDVTIGEVYSYDLDLRNQGNSDCTIDIEVLAHPPGVEVTMVPSSIKMQSFNTKVVRIEILQEEGSSQEGNIVLRVKSDAPGENSIQDYTFQYRSSRDVELSPQVYTTILIGGGFALLFFLIMVLFILFIRRKLRKGRVVDEK